VLLTAVSCWQGNEVEFDVVTDLSTQRLSAGRVEILPAVWCKHCSFAPLHSRERCIFSVVTQGSVVFEEIEPHRSRGVIVRALQRRFRFRFRSSVCVVYFNAISYLSGAGRGEEPYGGKIKLIASADPKVSRPVSLLVHHSSRV